MLNLRDFSAQFSSKIKAKCLILKDKAIVFTNEKLPKLSDKFEIIPLSNLDNYLKSLKDINKIFIDKITINIHDYSIIEEKTAFSVDNQIKNLKSVKTDEEIAHYKSAFDLTDKALSATKEFIENNKNITEFDIANNLEENFYKFGAKSLSFKSIVAKDKNSALAHYSKSSPDEIIKEGSMVLIDCGAYYEGGLATDITRVFVKGMPNKKQKQVYTTVLKGFLKAFNTKVTPNTTGYKIDRKTRKYLSEIAPKGFFFSHSLGHGIGINVHESPPTLGPSNLAKVPIVENMCFTIEPGLYNKKFGGVRLENSCYLAKEGKNLVIKSFTNMCFEDKLIDYNLLTPLETKQLKKLNIK